MYEWVRAMRDLTWDMNPEGMPDEPRTKREREWYRQGQAEAYAAVMSELERRGQVSR